VGKPGTLTAADETKLWDAVTGHDCYSYEDIGAQCAWSRWRAGHAVKALRRAASESRSWWTIAHVPRGKGRPPFRAVDAQTGQVLNDEDRRGILAGELESLESVRQQTLTGAATFRLLSEQLGGVKGKRCITVAKVMEGSGAMQERVIDDLRDELVSNGASV
jgi:hypothetical protein